MKRILLLGLLGTLAIGQARAESFSEWLFSFTSHKGVAPVKNAVYQEECGSCHYAYPPGLLPLRSWQVLLNNRALQDHFGENAELDQAIITELLAYVDGHSADQVWYKTSIKINQSLKTDDAPKRISETAYIKWRHEKVPKKHFEHAKVKSASYCDKCHQESESGVFEEDSVMIPDYGYWTW